MSDNTEEVGKPDRDSVNLNETYEVQAFVESIQRQAPNAATESIRDALDVANSATGSSSRELLTKKVLEILGSD